MFKLSWKVQPLSIPLTGEIGFYTYITAAAAHYSNLDAKMHRIQATKDTEAAVPI